MTLLVSGVSFAMTEALPGDIALHVAAARYDAEHVTAAAAAAVRRDLDSDAPAWRRYGRWLAALLRGQLGRSSVSDQPVRAVLAAPLRRTLLLVGVTWPAAVLIGVAAGAVLGWVRGGVSAANVIGALSAGTPSYVMGFALGKLFAIDLGWFPMAGYGGAAHLVLPAATLAILGGGRLALVTARATAAAAAHPSIAFARMKAVGPLRVVALHLLPLAAPAVVAYAFVGMAVLLEGSAVVETLFAYPGLGRLLVEAIEARDVPVIEGAAVLVGGFVVTANSLADVAAAQLGRLAGRG